MSEQLDPREVEGAKRRIGEPAEDELYPIGPDGREVSTQQETQRVIEAAAVRADSQAGVLTEEARDAALRARHPKPPLTEQEIAKLAEHRGQRPTKEDIEGINKARERGIHTGTV